MVILEELPNADLADFQEYYNWLFEMPEHEFFDMYDRDVEFYHKCSDNDLIKILEEDLEIMFCIGRDRGIL